MADAERALPGDISFECRVMRIESARELKDVHEQFHWSVDTTPPFVATIDGTATVSVAAPIAHLMVVRDGNLGQVVVLGQLMVKGPLLAGGKTANDFVSGFVEEMWDVGRRSLNMLAVQMDAQPLELPLRSPEIEIGVLTDVPTEDVDELARHAGTFELTTGVPAPGPSRRVVSNRKKKRV